ncbi:MAG: methionyl-tRNA formyltransferase [Clostridia bacterium]|nr:methionyl-tRNA formyltransferase [Clostridia bacterium]
MRILFMGTPDFAVPCLTALVEAGHTLVGAVSQPDQPKGRGHKLQPPPVKAKALEYNIPVFQPTTLRDGGFQAVLDETKPELIAVVAYGKILPKYILDYPRYGCVNVHGSLLPKYRGAAPIQWSVINGEKTTGITTMYMAEGLDTGDMILKAQTEIGETETYGELHDRLSLMGAELLVKTVEQLEKGIAEREEQNDAESCYAPMLNKETGHIDWTKSGREILNLIRGTNPWPMSFSLYKGTPMKLIVATMAERTGRIGEILSADKTGICIACGDGSILVKEIQMQGSKRMDVASYLNGHEIQVGTILE